MGFLTIVAISNDFWHDIAKKPQALVDGIGEAMNEGTGHTSPIKEVIRARETNEHRRRYDFRMEYFQPQGVEVFRARHFDEQQVIVNTYGCQPINAAELPYAIRDGWLDLNPYNAQHAERIAKELSSLAREIRSALPKKVHAPMTQEENG